jgi:addiction module HigA family antidote
MSKGKSLLELIPPGEILSEEFMKPHRLSQNRLARDLDVSPARVHDIVHGKSAITANIALRLAKYFGTTPQFWLNLQAEFDLRKAQREVGRAIEARVRTLDAAE